MYKVSYYLGDSNTVVFKWFQNLVEATAFSVHLPLGSVLEIKLYTDENKREDRT
jgi:hypothetical protein